MKLHKMEDTNKGFNTADGHYIQKKQLVKDNITYQD